MLNAISIPVPVEDILAVQKRITEYKQLLVAYSRLVDGYRDENTQLKIEIDFFMATKKAGF